MFNTKLVIETATALISKINETPLLEATTSFCVWASLYVNVAHRGEADKKLFPIAENGDNTIYLLYIKWLKYFFENLLSYRSIYAFKSMIIIAHEWEDLVWNFSACYSKKKKTFFVSKHDPPTIRLRMLENVIAKFKYYSNNRLLIEADLFLKFKWTRLTQTAFLFVRQSIRSGLILYPLLSKASVTNVFTTELCHVYPLQPLLCTYAKHTVFYAEI